MSKTETARLVEQSDRFTKNGEATGVGSWTLHSAADGFDSHPLHPLSAKTPSPLLRKVGVDAASIAS